SKLWIGSLATGLAAGVLTPPQTFLDLYRFFETFLTLFRLIWRGDEDVPTAHERAQSIARDRCLRTYRGVPPGSRPGICFCKDAVYEHGFLQVYSAVQQDKTVLDWLATGIIAIEQISDLQAIGISPALHSPRTLLERPDLESYVFSLKGS
ncbi:MAG: tyrosine/phenylalanine carboxypeptidase domain-containing protein, partial [Blastocatellia bacterium]